MLEYGRHIIVLITYLRRTIVILIKFMILFFKQCEKIKVNSQVEKKLKLEFAVLLN